MRIETIMAYRKNGARLRDCMPADAMTRLCALVEKLHSIRGTKPKDGESFAVAEELYKRLKETYGSITFEEMEIVTRDGLYSSTKNIMLSPLGIYSMIRDYVDSDEFLEANRRLNYVGEARQLAAYTPSQEDEDKGVRRMIMNDYNHFYKNGNWKGLVRCTLPRGTYCYDYLVRTNRIDPDAWKDYRGKKLSSHSMFSTVLDENVDSETCAKAVAYTRYIENKANEAKAKLLETEDLMC